MGITNITSLSDIHYKTSRETTKNLVDKIKNKKDGSSAKLENNSNQQKSLNLQLNFMTTFSETFEAKWHQHNQKPVI